MREFLHVDDLADACLFLMENYDGAQHVNVGSGKDVSIKELAELIRKTVGFKGELTFNTSKPDGKPRTLMDVSTMAKMGWKYQIELEDGIQSVYAAFKESAVVAEN